MAFVALEKLINFTDGYRRVFVVNHQRVLLIKENGRAYAFEADCPHKQWPLSLATVADNQITCPQHQASFSLSTGENISHCSGLPCRSLKIFTVHFEDTRVGIISP